MIRFHVADSLTGRLVGQLRPAAWTISEPVTGSSSGSLTLRVPHDAAGAARLRDLVQPRIRQVVMEVVAADGTSSFPFGGPIPRRASWTPQDDEGNGGTITVPVVDWRYWFETAAVLRPNAIMGTSTDYLVTDVEQTTAMMALMKAALGGTTGAPHMVVDAPAVTGVTRDVTARVASRYIGEYLDDIRDRNGDGSCDWYTYMTRSADKRTFLAHAAVAVPQRRSQAEPVAAFTVTPPKGSALAGYSWPEGVDQPTRVYAVGEGVPPDRVWASDELPDLTDGVELCWEQIAGPYQGVVKAATCFEDANSIVSQTGQLSGQMSITVTADRLGIDQVVAGDRVRLRLVDDWLDLDLPAVRIVQRDMSGQQDQPTQQTLTLDLSDPVPLPIDDPGVVGDVDGTS